MSTIPVPTGPALLEHALQPGALYPVYQPIVRLDDLAVVAHEGLIRLHDAPPGLSILDLLDLARARGRLGEMEIAAARTVASGFGYPAQSGQLFVNLSAQAILNISVRPDQVIAALAASGTDLGRFVVEITERDIVDEVDQLVEAIRFLRAAGIRIALDDFGNGHSNFELWHELGPDYVKIDRYLVHGLSRSAGRLSILKALIQVADTLGAELVGEGIEDEADLALLRDLGVRYGQGYLLARPDKAPRERVDERLAANLCSKLPVRPLAARGMTARHVTAGHLMIEAPAVAPETTNHEIARLFGHHPDLHALPVVGEDDAPLGLINRRVFMERFAQQYARELYGRKPCTMFMHAEPVRCETTQPVEAMVDVLRGEDQRYLSDGFIITEGGRFRGIGTGEALVRRVTELRVEAARYANPLTLLPGNIPITEHISRLLQTRRRFAAAYCDLNHFKPFNDQYGYFRGDQMIRLVADTLMRHVEPMTDFVGHVGGDDFVVLFQSEDWRERAARVVGDFDFAARALFDPDDLARGGLRAEDRQGHPAFFPLTTLAVGACIVPADFDGRAEDVAMLAATVKRRAKQQGVGLYVQEDGPAPALALAEFAGQLSP